MYTVYTQYIHTYMYMYTVYTQYIHTYMYTTCSHGNKSLNNCDDKLNSGQAW